MRIVVLLVVPLATLLPHVAHASTGDCADATLVEITGGSAGMTFYVRYFGAAPTGPVASGLWLYQESNGYWDPKPAGAYVDPVGDLQAGGSSPYVPGDNEPCPDDSDIGPDTLIF